MRTIAGLREPLPILINTIFARSGWTRSRLHLIGDQTGGKMIHFAISWRDAELHRLPAHEGREGDVTTAAKSGEAIPLGVPPVHKDKDPVIATEIRMYAADKKGY
ncbi:hypothetical protein [Streptomyces sp. NPDC017556]|uniref:hypothetical protein n=1 Tax=Streptomyces sp. NPDC017556 TaxID=3365002 RepID=UPI0037AF98AA